MDGRVPRPCVQANPDISGVGIRFSTYGQAFLNVAFALLLPPDATISYSELTPLATSTRTLFLTGWALLISAFYQSSMQGLTVHHTLVVLNLNWIIYVSALLHIFIRSCQAVIRYSRLVTTGRTRLPQTGYRTEAVAGPDTLRSIWQILLLPAAHLSALGFLGILLWAQVETFGDQRDCTKRTALTVFGSSYNVLDETIRRGSMALYWIVAIPLLNVVVTGSTAFIPVAAMVIMLQAAERVVNRQLLSVAVFARLSGVATISILLVLFISNTELMISRGVYTSLVGPGEEQWTFGQTLAIITLFLQLMEMVKMFSNWKGRDDRGSSPTQLQPRDS